MIKGYAKICLFVLLSLCLCGCVTLPQDYFSYCEKSFCAEVQGILRGSEFSAVVALSWEDGKSCVGVRYLSPASLYGLEVLAECDQSGNPEGAVQLSWEGLEGEADAATATGLLAPALALLTRGEIASVCCEEGLYRLTLTDGRTLLLDGDGAPKGVQGEQMTLEVRWLEWTSNLDLAKK